MTPVLFACLTLHIDYNHHPDAVKDKSLARATAHLDCTAGYVDNRYTPLPVTASNSRHSQVQTQYQEDSSERQTSPDY